MGARRALFRSGSDERVSLERPLQVNFIFKAFAGCELGDVAEKEFMYAAHRVGQGC